MKSAAAAGAAIAFAAAIAVVVAHGWGTGTPRDAAAAGRPVVVTSLSPRPLLFGDALVAEIDVTRDPAASHGKLRVEPTFAPFAVRGAPVVSRVRVGRLEQVRYRYTLECLTEECLPVDRPRIVRLGPVRVTSIGGTRRLSEATPWPAVLIASRLEPADIAAAKPQFRSPPSPPPPAYRIDPGLLANLLGAAAALLAAGGLLLLVVEGRRFALRARRRRFEGLDPLEAALVYTREAAARPDPADRRKALSLLAEALGGGEHELARSARRLAWAESAPTPERTLGVADDVSRNGSVRR